MIYQHLRTGVAFKILKEQSGTAGLGGADTLVRGFVILSLRYAVGDFGDLKDWVDFGMDLSQFTGAF